MDIDTTASGSTLPHAASSAMPISASASGPETLPAADLTAVISASGAHLLSYLPLGSLLTGQQSPTLVSTAFYDAVYHAIGTQFSELSFSSCPHLRKIDDEALIKIIRNIIEISQAHHPEYNRPVERRRGHVCEHTITCPCPINSIKYLDLSRCRSIKGEGVHFALKHLPNVRRISLSGAKRLDWLAHFVSERIIPDCYNKVQVHKLEAVDISACPKIDDLGLRSFLGSVKGHQIRVLDLSGCSTKTSDEIAGPISAYCRNLQSVSLAGMKKITAYAVGLIAHCCRDTLRSLNIRHCSKVHLMELLWRRVQHMATLLTNSNDQQEGNLPPEAIYPPAYAGDISNAGWACATYRETYSLSINRVLQLHQGDDWLERVSQIYEDNFLEFEERNHMNRNSISNINNMFGKLEHLDIGHIGKKGYIISGCLAAIAWLNGGRIRELNIAGLDFLSTAELNMLAMCSAERLQVLEMPVSLTRAHRRAGMGPLNLSHAKIFSSYVPPRITELDMSCLAASVVPSDGTTLSFLRNLQHCRVLKLDFLPVREVYLPPIPGLMKLSLQGCTQLTYNAIYNHLRAHKDGMMLELDIRGIPNESNLASASFSRLLPRLLMLNNRRTALGTAMKDEHAQIQNWRTGAKIRPTKSRKRKAAVAVEQEDEAMGAQLAETAVSGASLEDNSDAPLCKTCCSILRTGFRKDQDSEQEMFACRSCKIDFGRFVCYECAKKCHEGHDVVSIGFGAGYCDCSILSQCSCLEIQEEDQGE